MQERTEHMQLCWTSTIRTLFSVLSTPTTKINCAIAKLMQRLMCMYVLIPQSDLVNTRGRTDTS